MKRLVVVESPTKARTIRKFLPEDYQIEACLGHVRDLPANASEIPARLKKESWARLGVNVEEGFDPLYVIPRGKKKVIDELKAALKDADELYIATDEDREGESIGWHLLEVLKPRVPVRRLVFHEITPEALQGALEETRGIDDRLVEAQETRRILDRLVGYSISPLLWRKVAPKLSAGRVQSVAVRLLVLREKERLAFVSGSYWDLRADLRAEKAPFEAQLTHLNGTRIASGRDFDESTGKLIPERDVLLLDEATARNLADRLPGETWRVAQVETRRQTRAPYAPFITSTLQQEANRKLGLSARDTMRTAQRLYEQGLITYMRTDSSHLSNEAVQAARQAVEQLYGREYLSPKPKRFGSNRASAQEAHEAIRPAGTRMRTVDALRLGGVEGRLYDLIWKRTVASQMADARMRFTTVTLEAGKEDTTGVARFRSYGKEIEFPGFLRAYVEGTDDPEAALDDRENRLPALAEGDEPTCSNVEALGHETKPPARYTEATLVRALEEDGIGRPSTYASIIGTIIDRGYVHRQQRQLVPTFTAFAVTALLEEQFKNLVDVQFTARMETVLDEIASGDVDPQPYLESFYQGDNGLVPLVEKGLDQIDAREVSTITSSKWDPYLVRVGRYGPYVVLEQKGDELTAQLPENAAPADLSREDLARLVEQANSGDIVYGIHPEHDLPILGKTGPYGAYLQLGDDTEAGKPKRVSLPPGVTLEGVDFEMATALMDLPRTLGPHPETGNDVLAGIGRYGPFVQHERTFASLTKDDDVFTVGLDRALELIAKKTNRNQPIRTLGPHPETGDPIELFEGRYGPYVKHQRTNASLPKDKDKDDLTMDEAVALLAARKQKGRGRGRRTKAKKTS